jgi:hypothetical protein
LRDLREEAQRFHESLLASKVEDEDEGDHVESTPVSLPSNAAVSCGVLFCFIKQLLIFYATSRVFRYGYSWIYSSVLMVYQQTKIFISDE